MKGRVRGRIMGGLLGLVIVLAFVSTTAVYASPFGQGVYGADVPFGGPTSLAIALSGNVSLSLASDGTNLVGASSHTVTITSTDVVGYNLYVYCPGSCNMTKGSDVIAPSGNTSLLPLTLNSWGYNLDGSTNYLGMLTTPSLIKAAIGPYKNGDTTTVYYGAYTDPVKPSGSYTVNTVYTVVAASD